MRTRSQLVRNALLLIAAVVLVNLIGQRLKFRWDLTADDRYTLSPATRQMLDSLPEAVTITAFFTENMPPDLALSRQNLKDLLTEYAARGHGNIAYEFVDPNSADSLEQRARKEGIKPLLATTREKDKAENLQVFMGCVVRMGANKTVVPVIEQGASLEWALSSAIMEVSLREKPHVGIVLGHGEPSDFAMTQLVDALRITYVVEPMSIYDTLPIHDRFNALLIIDPQDTVPPAQLQRVNEFLAKGKGVVVAYGAVKSDINTSREVDIRQAGFDAWLLSHGVRVEPKILTDASCGQVQIMQPGYPVPIAIAFPFFIRTATFGKHPVTSGMDGAEFRFAAPISAADSSWRFTPLVMTSARTRAFDPPVMIDIDRKWGAADFPDGTRTIGAAVERKLGAASSSRMVVFSNGTFCVNGMGQQRSQLPPGNIDLMVNAVDWVSGSNALLALRGKEVAYRPLDAVSDGQRNAMKWIDLLLPTVLCILYGVLRAQWRRRQRQLRTAPDHVR